ncbi:hypothetical protein ADL22_27105 [Streptomyces sp. NRRL F-4489]|uniref:DUF6879 family protein n=1 Tax=Streptomyces sp. NRRL F-4489 TaxID=1609095 RepID=UPI00074A130C|nr:DUF6879 family protein [Streptomyces sp. NRRL F-4489]KUL35568.1 hypothetical protein ADL22_27105 [Streptomyces sp. NRRL F-4489]
MRDLHRPALPAERGERLSSEEYRRDFRARDASIRDGESWKLERLQHFEEVGSPARDALRRGDWAAVLRHLEEGRESLRGIQADEEARGSVFHRVRVVEEPLTPYLQYELHSLRISAEYGERVRVLSAKEVAADEAGGLLPELTIQDGKVLFKVLYTEDGAPDGAIRFTDPGIVAPWTAYVQSAYAAAEDIASYFDRVVAPLPPPPAA